MSEAREIELEPVARRVGGLDLVLVGANDPEGMRRHTQECRVRGIPFVADPSQQLAFADGPFIRRLIDGATYLFTNEYEAHLTEQKTGWSADEILERVGTRVITLGKDGAVIQRRGEPELRVPVADEVKRADPTGVGDAFRAGFLSGLAWGLDAQVCAELGSMLATYVIETVGTQEYVLYRSEFLQRFEASYGAEAAALVAPHLSCPRS
jgi:adenosine kinase